MTKEELLKPRYKVIADYPGQRYQIGDIIETYETAMCYAIGSSPFCEPEWSEKVCLSDYPGIFKRLEWWEERNEKDMPQFIRGVKGYFNGKMYRVAHPSQNGREWHIDHEIEHRTFMRYASDFLPADKSDYDAYISSKQ